MLQHLISQRRNDWLSQADCPIRELITYIRQTGKLRDAQICAIETYFFLKIVGQNQPLGQLFSDGFFNEDYDLDALPISQNTRDGLATVYWRLFSGSHLGGVKMRFLLSGSLVIQA